MKRLFTDFDGPIMDVSQRYFQVYLFCLEKVKGPNQLVSPLTKSEFWEFKRSQTSEVEIAIKSGLNLINQPQNFARLRRENINSKYFFTFDQIHPWAIAALETAQNAGLELAVMTMRREWELFPVLDRYDLHRFFKSDLIFCLKNDYIKTQDIKDKPKLMAGAIATLPKIEKQWMVGDTEADLVAASTHNIPSIGVLSGIRNQTQLEIYQPQAIAKDLQEAVEIIINTSA
ncbi:putative phosphatase [Synechococcus sp. PCC 7502]|uniref:HAD family hydrolase n=1 Tax=Synechococcus sp. PCC 7502 TaxID=1173263 RepID=UPI00029F8AE8|nr:HAD family hydrolase [Synechococcus sp. PCC 7502]AFY74184.1 putative phosphatase [Synechococcus sp. PCC 7502]